MISLRSGQADGWVLLESNRTSSRNTVLKSCIRAYTAQSTFSTPIQVIYFLLRAFCGTPNVLASLCILLLPPFHILCFVELHHRTKICCNRPCVLTWYEGTLAGFESGLIFALGILHFLVQKVRVFKWLIRYIIWGICVTRMRRLSPRILLLQCFCAISRDNAENINCWQCSNKSRVIRVAHRG